MHPRAVIRAKFVELLTGTTDCGNSVYRSRARPFIHQEDWQNELPALNVYVNTETSDRFDEAPRLYQRKANIVVEVHVAADDDSDEVLDTICQQVETAIGRFDWHLGSVDYDLGSTQMLLVEVGPSVTNAAAAITFEMTYYSNLPDAGKTELLEDLLSVHSTFRVGTPETDSLQIVNFVYPTVWQVVSNGADVVSNGANVVVTEV